VMAGLPYIKTVHWFETLGMSAEPQLREILDRKVVSGDGVHLSVEANRSAAVYLCRRFLVGEMEDFPEGKRRRLY
jgi:hypothetical protein